MTLHPQVEMDVPFNLHTTDTQVYLYQDIDHVYWIPLIAI
jgi:hypothetical protein